jgi:hypothetical protein
MSLFTEARQGQLPDVGVIDCHGHAGPFYGYPIADPGPTGMLRTMDAAGIEKLMFAPHLAICPDPEEGNRLAAEIHEAHPDRLLPYCTIGPRRPERAVRAQLEEYIASGRFVGIKLHPSLQRTVVSDPAYEMAFQYAEAHAVPILVHTWEGDGFASPDMVADMAAKHPGAETILAHSAGAHTGMARVIALAHKHANLWLEISGSTQPWGAMERLCEELGAERVLFGSDLPFLDPRPKLGAVVFAGVSDAAKRAILRDNAVDLFGFGEASA